MTLRPRALNWKTIADNYSDGLHIPVGHPGLTRLFGATTGSRRSAMSTRWRATWSRSPRPIRPSAPTSSFLPKVEHLPATHQRKWLYYKLFPNVAFDIYPDQVDFMQFLPVSATETIIREISYALPDDRREMKAARYLNWRINRRVNAEDTELITRVQLGMQSPSYVAGPLGTSEVCLRSFARSSAADSRGAAGLAAAAGLEPLQPTRDSQWIGRPVASSASAQQDWLEPGAIECQSEERGRRATRPSQRPTLSLSAAAAETM